jgi:Zn-dependent protease
MLHLGSIGGTPIDVDPSFFFLLFFFVIVNYNPALGMQYALLWIPILFLSVLLHELGHAAMIGILGYGSSHIILGGMGGVTINARTAKAWQNMLISLAGVGVSFALWLAIAPFSRAPAVVADPFFRALVPLLAAANLFWGIFNSIPLPPLDGGGATRNFFRTFLDERKAFVISVWIAMVAGLAAIVWLAMHRSILMAMLFAMLVFRQYQQWRDFQERGAIGDDQ